MVLYSDDDIELFDDLLYSAAAANDFYSSFEALFNGFSLLLSIPLMGELVFCLFNILDYSITMDLSTGFY